MTNSDKTNEQRFNRRFAIVVLVLILVVSSCGIGLLVKASHDVRGANDANSLDPFTAMVEKCEPTEGLYGAPKYTVSLVGQDMMTYVHTFDAVFSQEELAPGTRVLLNSYDKWYIDRHPHTASRVFIWFAEPLPVPTDVAVN